VVTWQRGSGWGAVAAIAVALAGASAARAQTAPGAPGAKATWTSADKHGFGTSTTRASKVWHTLSDGALTEVYFPDLGTPSVRTLDFVITDGKTWQERDDQASRRHVSLADDRSLTYRQVDTEPGRFRITKTYVTDPGRNTLLIRVNLRSLTGKKLHAYAVYDPGLGNDGMDDNGTSRHSVLTATDTGSPVASALIARPAFTRTSSGYLGTSDGWTDLKDFRMDWKYTSAPNGNLVQTGRTRLTGLRHGRHATLALGFGTSASAAQSAATGSLARPGAVATAYRRGWHAYLDGLKPVPTSADPTTYRVSAMVLAASEDKTYRGG
jgi:glucoamylase